MPASGDTYDYVIVGGGSAGCCLAARLSGAPHAPRVLLLEAGPLDTARAVTCPAAGEAAAAKYDWGFRSAWVAHTHTHGARFPICFLLLRGVSCFFFFLFVIWLLGWPAFFLAGSVWCWGWGLGVLIGESESGDVPEAMSDARGRVSG
jgi:hypothetical protein